MEKVTVEIFAGAERKEGNRRYEKERRRE